MGMGEVKVPPYRIDTLYRTEILTIIQNKIDEHPRSAQQEIGPSGVGGCERKVAFSLAYGAATEGPGGWAAHKGTVLHGWLDETFSSEELKMPDGSARFLTEIKLKSGSPNVSGGTCDMYDRLKQAVVDWKLPGDYTVSKVRTGDVNPAYYIQANVYGYHSTLMGLPVSTVNLAFLPMAGDDLWGTAKGAIFCTWDYDESVAKDAIANVDRIRTMLDLAPANKVIEGMATRSDFCSSCPAYVGSSDRRGTCPGAAVQIPKPSAGNPFA